MSLLTADCSGFWFVICNPEQNLLWSCKKQSTLKNLSLRTLVSNFPGQQHLKPASGNRPLISLLYICVSVSVCFYLSTKRLFSKCLHNTLQNSSNRESSTTWHELVSQQANLSNTNLKEPAASHVADRQREHVLSLIATAVMYYADHLFNLESVASEKHNIWTLKVKHQYSKVYLCCLFFSNYLNK